MADNIFDPDALRAIVTTPLTAQQQSRRGGGGVTLMDIIDKAKRPNNRGSAQRFIDPDGVCPRERETRWDVKLTATWVQKMQSVNVAFRRACELVEGIRNMNPKCKRPKWNGTL